MTSFLATAFSESAFSVLAFDFGGAPPPPPTEPVQGYQSGSYVTKMTEAEFERRRAVFKTDIDGMIYRMTGEKAKDEMLAAMEAVARAKNIAQRRAREKNLSALIDRQIMADHIVEVNKMAAAQETERQRQAWESMIEAEDEEIALNFLIH